MMILFRLLLHYKVNVIVFFGIDLGPSDLVGHGGQILTYINF